MRNIEEKIEGLDWEAITNKIQEKGNALVTDILDSAQCTALIKLYNGHQGYRKTVLMERYRFGQGEYKYFDNPLPEPLGQIREKLYSKLVPLANKWGRVLNMESLYPPTHPEFLEQCRNKGQGRPTPLILKYGKGGFNTLHQDLYGEIHFPIQAVFFLSRPGTDFTGGEFVMTQQNPRAQSKAIVLSPNRGDMLLFPTNFRPVKGSRGYYRATVKHGVSELHTGERYTLGIPFHDALN
ncbi:MAG: 2OG-Fe(II) oxygenase [Sediminicola sp.]|tara:strand:- start:166780 stop:167493 length:714 start_codon:yes stop_codon:yes gene_type:complete